MEEINLILVGRLEGDESAGGLLETRSVLHLRWDGSTWSQPQEVARYIGDVPEWPSIAVSEGNVLNVAWFVRDAASVWQSESGHYSVWYASRITDGPSLTPVPNPAGSTPDTRASPTIAAGDRIVPGTDTEQEGPQPTFGPIGDGIVQEFDLLMLIGRSLIPALLFIAGSIVYLALRRR